MNEQMTLTPTDRPASIEQPEPCWMELRDGQAEMQKIIHLLVDFDERTGRFKRFEDQSSHWMRKAVSVCNPKDLRIFAKRTAEWVYLVSVHALTNAGSVRTSWVHEDGIRMERDSAPADHPVHTIVCLTDLVERYGQPPEEQVREELEADSLKA